MKPNATRSLRPALAAVALALSVGTSNCLASDAVAESFDRMLGHVPGQGSPLNPFAREVDALAHSFAIALGTDAGLQPAADPVAESFARMLSHVPQAITPPAPAGFEPDPLVAAMIEPLRGDAARGPTLAKSARATGGSLR
jgi:hypothetical protein